MDESNCLGIHCFAEIHSCSDLMNKAKTFVLKHFQEIIEGEEFINITEVKLIEIISSDDLEVDKEETVFHACIKWLNHQQRVPKSFHHVLEHIRLPLLTPYFIHDVVERTPAVSESAECRSLVEEARLYHLLPDRCVQETSSHFLTGNIFFYLICFSFLGPLLKMVPSTLPLCHHQDESTVSMAIPD